MLPEWVKRRDAALAQRWREEPERRFGVLVETVEVAWETMPAQWRARTAAPSRARVEGAVYRAARAWLVEVASRPGLLRSLAVELVEEGLDLGRSDDEVAELLLERLVEVAQQEVCLRDLAAAVLIDLVGVDVEEWVQ